MDFEEYKDETIPIEIYQYIYPYTIRKRNTLMGRMEIAQSNEMDKIMVKITQIMECPFDAMKITYWITDHHAHLRIYHFGC